MEGIEPDENTWPAKYKLLYQWVLKNPNDTKNDCIKEIGFSFKAKPWKLVRRIIKTDYIFQAIHWFDNTPNGSLEDCQNFLGCTTKTFKEIMQCGNFILKEKLNNHIKEWILSNPECSVGTCIKATGFSKDIVRPVWDVVKGSTHWDLYRNNVLNDIKNWKSENPDGIFYDYLRTNPNAPQTIFSLKKLWLEACDSYETQPEAVWKSILISVINLINSNKKITKSEIADHIGCNFNRVTTAIKKILLIYDWFKAHPEETVEDCAKDINEKELYINIILDNYDVITEIHANMKNIKR